MIFGRDIGIDLGTTTVLVSSRGRGIILREPAVVAMDKGTGRLLSAGMAAQRMLGRTPGNIVAIRPLRAGAISDYEMTERMLHELTRKAVSVGLFKPRVIISVPSGITEVEERAVIDAGMSAGARRVYLMEAPLAAAIGAGLDITRADGHMVVDIGGGTTDIAVLSLGGVVESSSLKDGGEAFDEELVRYVKRRHNVLIGDATAEEVKKNIGCVFPRAETTTVDVKGRNLMTGLPSIVSINTTEILEAFEEMSEQVIEAIQQVLEATPPELVADVSQNGIVLTGGGALLWGFDKLIESRTGISTRVADDPELCVAYGLAKSTANIENMREGTINLSRRRQMKQ
ncbi:MAG: rod shape-determining protein MreB [Oscillospiraceae bacterium]|jgi:rod shape-determining protein MreB|nr:rod shape-determining protein MreB [Oscillospiraceae bacterium]